MNELLTAQARAGTQSVRFQTPGCPRRTGGQQRTQFLMLYVVKKNPLAAGQSQHQTPTPGAPTLSTVIELPLTLPRRVQSRGKGKGKKNGDMVTFYLFFVFWSQTILCFLSSILDLPLFVSFIILHCFVLVLFLVLLGKCIIA